MKIEITCDHCHNKFIGGSTHRKYCDVCRKNESAAIARAVADRKKKPCPDCSKLILQETERCNSCTRKASRATVAIHCSRCTARFMPVSWRQANAKLVFCPDCRTNHRAECDKMAWSAAKQRQRGKGSIGHSVDRRILRLVAEAQNSVKVVFDREKNIGKLPANLLAQYPSLAVDGSIPSTPPPRRSHHAKTTQAPRRVARKKGLSIEQFIQKRTARVQNDYRENVG